MSYSWVQDNKWTAHNEQTAKYNPLVHVLRTTDLQVNPLITITIGVIGAIHKQPIKYLFLFFILAQTN